MRTGCTVLGFALLLLVIASGLLLYLATRPAGPHYAAGVYTVADADGSVRTDRISTAAAQSFNAKLSPSLDPLSLLRLQRNGVDFSEEEVNSELDQQLRLRPINAAGLDVRRLFLELHASHSTAYVYGTLAGVAVTLSAGVNFTVSNGMAQVHLKDPRAGSLPIGIALPYLLEWTGNTDRIQNLLALALPQQVSSIEPREGVLHVGVNLAAGTGVPRPPAGQLVWPDSTSPAAVAEPAAVAVSLSAGAVPRRVLGLRGFA
jgi:hypothetical protein